MAGLVNAIAGGGPILTIAALLLLGVDARTANLTSTVGLMPGQVVAGWHGRASFARLGSAGMRRGAISTCLIGGALGAAALLLTPSAVFLTLVPWLVLFATIAYAASGRVRLERGHRSVDAKRFLVPLAALSIYGGYYGGGNSFMVLALLAWRGIPAVAAGHAKNLLIAIINAAAVSVFVASGDVDRATVIPLAAGGIVGSMLGIRFLGRVPARWFRAIVIVCGLTLSGWLFVAR